MLHIELGRCHYIVGRPTLRLNRPNQLMWNKNHGLPMHLQQKGQNGSKKIAKKIMRRLNRRLSMHLRSNISPKKQNGSKNRQPET